MRGEMMPKYGFGDNRRRKKKPTKIDKKQQEKKDLKTII